MTDTGPTFFWIPVTFSCGHGLDMGTERGDQDKEVRRLNKFITVASEYPCPHCGSASGRPHTKPVSPDPTYLRANDVWYKALTPDRTTDADRNAKLAEERREAIRSSQRWWWPEM